MKRLVQFEGYKLQLSVIQEYDDGQWGNKPPSSSPYGGGNAFGATYYIIANDNTLEGL